MFKSHVRAKYIFSVIALSSLHLLLCYPVKTGTTLLTYNSFFFRFDLCLSPRPLEMQRPHETTTAAALGNTSRSASTHATASSAPTWGRICWRNHEWCFRWAKVTLIPLTLAVCPPPASTITNQRTGSAFVNVTTFAAVFSNLPWNGCFLLSFTPGCWLHTLFLWRVLGPPPDHVRECTQFFSLRHSLESCRVNKTFLSVECNCYD